MIPPIATSGAPATGTSAASSPSGGFAGGDFETFLKMLTTQIRNQDPLNPMEGADFAVQLATFSGVEQQVRTNQLLEALAGADQGRGLAQYAGWIGREVRLTAPVWFENAPVTLEIAADPAADQVVLVTRNARGQVASREAIGPGSGPVEWLGRDAGGAVLPPGSYSFRIENWKGGTLLSERPAPSYSRVTGVETGSAGPELLLRGGGRVAAAEVTALRDPATAASQSGS
ncbi:flagellar basal body rod modification protein [Paracoccus sp. S-4012]|uniref:flagellar hook capping FlgD N-terminal domain-containing protein n=1 Tax=Paracoccus sp. S-4012 TaxID=2665648 RepID=UPI0012B07CBA|nr:flagellar hook capping FlgD N-terminal domain-containing protein [Paracoccus sp. S-4012]MRX49023.1 flagellar basal body rod modification protein [Paracoccus sp. S-4012]